MIQEKVVEPMIEEKIVIKCDKCGGTNVIDERKKEVKEIKLSMDEYISRKLNIYQSSGTITDFNPEIWVLKCKDCGFVKEYKIKYNFYWR